MPVVDAKRGWFQALDYKLGHTNQIFMSTCLCQLARYAVCESSCLRHPLLEAGGSVEHVGGRR